MPNLFKEGDKVKVLFASEERTFYYYGVVLRTNKAGTLYYVELEKEKRDTGKYTEDTWVHEGQLSLRTFGEWEFEFTVRADVMYRTTLRTTVRLPVANEGQEEPTQGEHRLAWEEAVKRFANPNTYLNDTVLIDEGSLDIPTVQHVETESMQDVTYYG